MISAHKKGVMGAARNARKMLTNHMYVGLSDQLQVTDNSHAHSGPDVGCFPKGCARVPAASQQIPHNFSVSLPD